MDFNFFQMSDFSYTSEIFTKTGSFHCFARARKTNLVDLKKRRPNFEKFLKIRPRPFNKNLDPPLNQIEMTDLTYHILIGQKTENNRIKLSNIHFFSKIPPEKQKKKQHLKHISHCKKN